MKRILFVCNNYYPHPSPTGLCVEKVMKKCRERGYDVVCLAGHHYQEAPGFDMVDGIPVYRVMYSRPVRILSQWRQMKNRPLAVVLRILAGASLSLRHLFLFLLWPMVDIAAARRLRSRLFELHRERPFDAVIAVHVPIEALYAVCSFKKRVKTVPCVLYYIDALSGGNQVRKNERRFGYLPFKSLFFKAAKRWELLFAKRAEKIIVMEAARKHYERYFSGTDLSGKLCFLNIPFFEEKAALPASSPRRDCTAPADRKVTILYLGNIYALRDPSFIIKVAERIDRKDVRWLFIGYCCKEYKKLLLQAEKKRPAQFTVRDRIPHEEVLPYLNQADFFLNIGESLPSVVSGKVFEYISYGKPIISTFPIRDNSSIPVLEKYPYSLALYTTDDLHRSAERLNRFLADCLGKRCAFDEIREHFYTAAPDAFADVIDGLWDRSPK